VITDYASLKSAVADYLNRQDLTSVIPTFIQLAEKEFNRTLRVREMLNRSQATINTQYIALPDRFLEMRNLRIDTSRGWKSLRVMSPEQIDENRTTFHGNVTGEPEGYTLNPDDSIEVTPAPDDTYTVEMTFYQGIEGLSDSTDTNWMLDKNPDLYLFGALLQSAPYLKEDERIAVWSGLYRSLFTDIQAESDRAKYAGSTPIVRAKAIG
jgi:hypothetical protein